MNPDLELSSQTKEFIKGELTASVNLDTQTVEVAFLTGSPTADTDWQAAEWIGAPDATRSWRVLVQPGDLDAGTKYNVWSRVTDASESTVRKHPNRLKVV